MSNKKQVKNTKTSKRAQAQGKYTKTEMGAFMFTLGLGQREAEIYLAGLEIGCGTVDEIADKSGIKRVTVYTYIDNLMSKGFFSETKKGNKRIFIPEEPNTLKTILEGKKQEAENLIKTLKELGENSSHIFEKLNSIYKKADLSKKIPEIKYYEGLGGLKTAMYDSLSAKEEIYTYANALAMEESIKEINDFYIKERISKKIKKKVLVIKTDFSSDFIKNYDKIVTEFRFIETIDFAIECEIYGGKVVFLILKDNEFLAISIENKEFYNMHRALFELNWKNAEIIDIKNL